MKRIRSLEGLMLAVRHRRAVCITLPSYTMRTAAAFVIGMPARVVYDYIQRGMFVYPRPPKDQGEPEKIEI